MLGIWRALLFLALLWGAGWFWSRTQSDASLGKDDATEVGIRNGVVESAAKPTAKPHPQVGARPASTGAPMATGAAAQSATFHFDLGVVEPDEGQDLWPSRLVVGDVTGDRRPDIVMSLEYAGDAPNRGDVLVRIYAQTPSGTLARPTEIDIKPAVGSWHGMELVDLDGNGILEIAVVDAVRLTLLEHVGGRFESRQYVGPSMGIFPAAVDANGDGAMDLFAQGWDYGVDVFLGDGRGGVLAVDHIDTPDSPDATVEASDFTADGLPDVLVQSGHGVRIYPSRYGSALGAPIKLDLAAMQVATPWGMTVADIDQDSRPDLVVSDHGDGDTTPVPKGVHILYRGSGNSFSHSVFLETDAPYLWPDAVRVADVDGNGYPDVVTMLGAQDRLGYFLQGPSGFSPMAIEFTDDDPYSLSSYYDNSFVIADVNSDRCLDVVLADMTSSLRVFYGRNCQVTLPRPSKPLRPQRR